MVWGYTCGPDGKIISVNCDNECFFNEDTDCELADCPMRHHKIKPMPLPNYNTYRWKASEDYVCVRNVSKIFSDALE